MNGIKSFFKKITPQKGELSHAVSSFSKKEFSVFLSLAAILLISTIGILSKINSEFTVHVPTPGGSISEGIVGIPRFINPVLALSDADKDLTAIVYSVLMKKSVSGDIVPDLAERYEVSKDGLTYTFYLKSGNTFQDRQPVTADDIVYTINEIKDPAIKSPKNVSWNGVSVEKIDDMTVAFHLKTPYAPFLENTTVGILPAHIWKNVSAEEFAFSDFNTDAVGSGPYKIDSISKSSSGVPQYYVLVPSARLMPSSYVSKITIRFYANENDLIAGLESGEVNSGSGISPEHAAILASKGYRIETTVLPRMIGLFFNQNQAPIFLDKAVVTALDLAVDKQKIIDQVLHGYGMAIDGPVPAYLLGEKAQAAESFDPSQIEQAKALLVKDGWTMGSDGVLEKKIAKKPTLRLSFSISTGDTPELKQAAELLQQNFQAIGAGVDVKVFDTGSLNQSVIRPRKYDALFFGQAVSHESDLFAYWDSSQRNDPGLNIAMYANTKADKLLESSLTTLDQTSRTKEYLAFQDQFAMDKPAIFVYSPEFIYVVSKNIQGNTLGQITVPAERFDGITNWYIDTDTIWKIFVKNQ
jgi:peptide/nickel transport system substrate-binding protein